MEFCLYDPVHGYYRRGKPVIGPQGDFVTSPHLHPLFARILGRCVACCLRRLGSNGPLQLVELGAGDGTLARDLLAYLSRAEPALSRRVEYLPLEISGGVLPPTIRGLVFSNEFFDALPVHRVRVREGRLREIYVECRRGCFQELEGDLSDPRIEAFMRTGFPVWEEGAAYEVNLAMVELLQDLKERLRQGVMLTIDYGYSWSDYAARRRPEGTLLCYHRHQALEDPYQRIGEQDMTAHISFEVLRKMGRGFGWKDLPLLSQREFLMRWGLQRELAREEEQGWFHPGRLQQRMGLARLLAPSGISDTLKVLLQATSREYLPAGGKGEKAG